MDLLHNTINFIENTKPYFMKKISILFLIVLLSLVPLLGAEQAPLLFKFREFFLTFCYIVFAALLWRNKYTRIVSVILVLLWTVNSAIAIIIYQLFDSQLNYQLAMTILSTNRQESQDFLFAYWHILFISSLLFCALLYFVHVCSETLSRRVLLLLSAILLLTVTYKYAESAFRGRLSDPSFNMAEKVLPYTSLYNFGIFSRAYQELNLLNTVANYTPTYHYSRPTTPNIENQLSNLFVFEQAIAPAPITTMALASALTIKAPDDMTPTLLNDNIVNMANHAGFETYWFSRQNVIGQYETVVTSIAKSAQHKEWLSSGYDDVLLTKLDEALASATPDKKKKLIILHTNGSHLSACNQYPKEDGNFTHGRSEYEDCYDNSILFTDKLLGQIFAKLSTQHASVLYFSDHGQLKRIKRGEIDYVHGAINPSKESVDVPQFIWFSPRVELVDKTIGSYAQPYSTTNNYWLVANWLGINKINGTEISSPLKTDYLPQDKIIIMDTRLNIFDYRDLPADNN